VALHYIYLKKIKYTIYGKKNIIFISNLARVNKTNPLLRLTIKNYKLNINFSISFHTKVKASKRIGPHNEDIISVLVGSLLGDCYGNRRSL